MKLNPRAFTMSWTILWAVLVMGTGLANMAFTGYGQPFLELISSFYPGYHVTQTIGSVIVGTAYAIVDAAIGSFIFVWLYNRFSPASQP